MPSTRSTISSEQAPWRGASLHVHTPRPHVPHNANDTRRSRLTRVGFNTWLAVRITLLVGTMWTAYAFTLLAISGFPGIHASPTQLVQWFSQTFLQLVMLPILAVGTAVLSRQQEAQADEQYKATLNTFHDTEQLAQHLAAQDTVLLQILAQLSPPSSSSSSAPAA